jgi:hypothetical protein
MRLVKKTRDAIIIFVLLLISFVRTSLGRNKPLPVSHADVPGVTQGLLFRHASGPAYSLETAKKFPFLRFVKDAAPGFDYQPPDRRFRKRARFLGPAGRMLLFGGPVASLRRQYAIEFGGTFPYMRLSSAGIGRVGAALEFSSLRTSASADLRAYSLAIGPSSWIYEHGALADFANIAYSVNDCCTTTTTSCTTTTTTSCTTTSCTTTSCTTSSCTTCGPSCSCCSSCDCSSCISS